MSIGSPDILVTDEQTYRQTNRQMQAKTVYPALRQVGDKNMITNNSEALLVRATRQGRCRRR